MSCLSKGRRATKPRYGSLVSDPVEAADSAAATERPRAHHDLGGVPRFLCQEIDTEPHALTEFDREVDALRQLLALKGLMTVDELRRGIEAIPEPDYLWLSYYQKWIRSITATLIRRGVLDPAEIAARLGEEPRP